MKWLPSLGTPAFALALLVSAVPFIKAQANQAVTTTDATGLKRQLDASAPAWLKQDDVPSVAVAYIRRGRIAWTAVYGDQGPGIPATPNTLYNMASLTKPVTAEVILRMAADHKISLDESMSHSWIDPDIKGNPWTDLLTPRINLSHQTGFANWRRMTNGVLTFQWEPGTKMGYSGEGYNYLVRFAENKEGVPFEDLASKYVFDSLGMKDTAYTPKPWFSGRLAMPYGPRGWEDDAKTWNVSGADLLRTTIGDYAKFVVSVMHNQGLSPDLAAQRSLMTRDRVKPEEREKICAKSTKATACIVTAGMGLGWQVDHFDMVTLLEHSGSDSGVHTLAFFEPRIQTGVVIFTNGENGPRTIARVAALLYPNPMYLQTMK
jgi:CubicO group peptidase (beta-lactamase class C family)